MIGEYFTQDATVAALKAAIEGRRQP